MKTLLFITFLSILCLCVGLLFFYGSENSTFKQKPSSSCNVWKDPSTGLMWQVSPTGGEMDQESAQKHCKSLSLGGKHDWRLPTISELRTLIRGCPATQKGGACDISDSCLRMESCGNDACQGCYESQGHGLGKNGEFWPPELHGSSQQYDCGSYWSSSKAMVEQINFRLSMRVNFDTGQVGNAFFSACRNFNVRCVRNSISR